MQELINVILNDLYTEIQYAEARNDHRAVDILRMVCDKIEARQYEHSAMVEAKEEINYNKFLEVMRDTDE
jgi:hypothetical protein